MDRQPGARQGADSLVAVVRTGRRFGRRHPRDVRKARGREPARRPTQSLRRSQARRRARSRPPSRRRGAGDDADARRPASAHCPRRLPVRHRWAGERRRQPDQSATAREVAARDHCADDDHRFPRAHRARRRSVRGARQVARPRRAAVSEDDAAAARALALLSCTPATWRRWRWPCRRGGRRCRSASTASMGATCGDLDGSSRALPMGAPALSSVRHALRRAVADLERYLVERVVRCRRRECRRICNGVDTERFRPADRCASYPGLSVPGSGALAGRHGRTHATGEGPGEPGAGVRRRAIEVDPDARAGCAWCWSATGRCAPTRARCSKPPGLIDLAWLPGERAGRAGDPARAWIALSCPLWSEGISNTILEAMASGLPVIATAVGGNPELIEAGRTGELVPAADPEALGASASSPMRAIPARRELPVAPAASVSSAITLSMAWSRATTRSIRGCSGQPPLL